MRRWTALAGFLMSFVAMAASLSYSVAVTVALFALLLILLGWQWRALRRLLFEGHWIESYSSVMAVPADGGAADGGAAAPIDVSERVERAAVYVHDALQGQCRGGHWAASPMARIRAQRQLRALRYLRRINLGVIIGLGFVERPVWCYALRSCGDPANVPAFGLPVLPLWASLGTEAACIAFFFWEMSYKVAYMSHSVFFSSPVHLAQLLLLLFDAAGVAVSALRYPSPMP